MILLLFTPSGPSGTTGPGTGQNYGLLLALVSEGGAVVVTDGNFRLFGLPMLS